MFGYGDLDLNNYTSYVLTECSDEDTLYGVILLHNNFDIKDFQKAINKVKDTIFKDTIDWTIDDILCELDNDFDFVKLNLGEYKLSI